MIIVFMAWENMKKLSEWKKDHDTQHVRFTIANELALKYVAEGKDRDELTIVISEFTRGGDDT